MSSILTNNGAMIALQTLQNVNKNLGMVQSEISTGKSVGSARDNSAVWAISKQMESDVKGFESIQESLGLGQSTVATARSAAETVTDLLTDIKGKIVAAQEENVDRAKIQTDIDALTDQIETVVGAAQFNGLNLLDGSSDDALTVLSSLNRGSDGTVSPQHITVDRQNLNVTEPVDVQVAGTVAHTAAATTFGYSGTTGTNGTAAVAATKANNTSEEITVGPVEKGDTFTVLLEDLDIKVEGGGTTTGSRSFTYVATDNDGGADVAKALSDQINNFLGVATEGANAYSVAVDETDPSKFTFTNGDATTTNGDVDVTISVFKGGTPGSSADTGGLGALQTIDVTDGDTAAAALGAIDALINKSIDAAAALGSAQGRIDTQTDFVDSLIDNFKSGIGTLVDANMEEASARLQALQVQQQLATQSLSIANQAPQSILSLFR